VPEYCLFFIRAYKFSPTRPPFRMDTRLRRWYAWTSLKASFENIIKILLYKMLVGITEDVITFKDMVWDITFTSNWSRLFWYFINWEVVSLCHNNLSIMLTYSRNMLQMNQPTRTLRLAGSNLLLIPRELGSRGLVTVFVFTMHHLHYGISSQTNWDIGI